MGAEVLVLAVLLAVAAGVDHVPVGLAVKLEVIAAELAVLGVGLQPLVLGLDLGEPVRNKDN